jgi:hypothetical protein
VADWLAVVDEILSKGFILILDFKLVLYVLKFLI